MNHPNERLAHLQICYIGKPPIPVSFLGREGNYAFARTIDGYSRFLSTQTGDGVDYTRSVRWLDGKVRRLTGEGIQFNSCERVGIPEEISVLGLVVPQRKFLGIYPQDAMDVDGPTLNFFLRGTGNLAQMGYTIEPFESVSELTAKVDILTRKSRMRLLSLLGI